MPPRGSPCLDHFPTGKNKKQRHIIPSVIVYPNKWGLISFAAYNSIIGEKMKFGKSVKFVMCTDTLNQFDIAGDVNQLSELVDRINEKSNSICVLDLLSNIQSSLNDTQV